MDQPPIPVFLPYLGPEVHEAARQALEDGWLGLGPLTKRLEEELSAYLRLSDRYLVATSSCTAALHCALLLAGVGPGDEVICPSFTYVATHQAVGMTGADVVFCDIEEHTFGADPLSVRSMVSDRTKAILVVHFAGLVCQIDEIYAIAREHELRVVEDAAHAFGSSHQGKPVGSFGDLTCFSFGPVKMITVLEGGAVITPQAGDVQTLHEFRLLGVDSDTDERYRKSRAWEYDVVRQGYRYHLGSVPAAIGLSQLAMVDTFVANRRRYCRMYNERLAAIPDVLTPDTDFSDVGPFIYVIRTPDHESRSGLMKHLKERGIGSGIHFLGAHELSLYQTCRRDDLSVTEKVSQQVVTLPLHSFMEERTIDRVVEEVSRYFS